MSNSEQNKLLGVPVCNIIAAYLRADDMKVGHNWHSRVESAIYRQSELLARLAAESEIDPREKQEDDKS